MQLADDAAAVIHLDLFIAGNAVQHIFVVAFDAQLADIVRCGVVRPLALFIEARHVAIVDFGDVADDVRQRRAVGVVATLIAFHLDPGKAVLVDGEARHLHVVKADLNGNRGKATRALALFVEGVEIIVGDIQHRAQIFQRLLEVVDFFRHQLRLIDGAVKRQGGAVAVIDNAAARRHRHQLDAVFVRAGTVIFKAQDLQVVKIDHQHAREHQNSEERN